MKYVNCTRVWCYQDLHHLCRMSECQFYHETEDIELYHAINIWRSNMRLSGNDTSMSYFDSRKEKE